MKIKPNEIYLAFVDLWRGSWSTFFYALESCIVEEFDVRLYFYLRI